MELKLFLGLIWTRIFYCVLLSVSARCSPSTEDSREHAALSVSDTSQYSLKSPEDFSSNRSHSLVNPGGLQQCPGEPWSQPASWIPDQQYTTSIPQTLGSGDGAISSGAHKSYSLQDRSPVDAHQDAVKVLPGAGMVQVDPEINLYPGFDNPSLDLQDTYENCYRNAGSSIVRSGSGYPDQIRAGEGKHNLTKSASSGLMSYDRQNNPQIEPGTEASLKQLSREFLSSPSEVAPQPASRTYASATADTTKLPSTSGRSNSSSAYRNDAFAEPSEQDHLNPKHPCNKYSLKSKGLSTVRNHLSSEDRPLNPGTGSNVKDPDISNSRDKGTRNGRTANAWPSRSTPPRPQPESISSNAPIGDFPPLDAHTSLSKSMQVQIAERNNILTKNYMPPTPTSPPEPLASDRRDSPQTNNNRVMERVLPPMITPQIQQQGAARFGKKKICTLCGSELHPSHECPSKDKLFFLE